MIGTPAGPLGEVVPFPEASVKVSVVVPVYNPGRDIEPCIDSLLHQSLPLDQYEAIFVDDGSTDATPARLDALAAEHSHFRVSHIPNSGWPGRPRNVGVGQARGEYVQFVDQDDHLGPEALERLHAMGRANGADIVIGKVAGNFRVRDAGASHAIRGVPDVLFRRSRDACTVLDAPLIDSLTPHKMFRTAFLREHGLAFPDGRLRLEDQLFIVPAYFAARTVSVLSDYVCYYYTEREDGRNAGSVQIDPTRYCADLRHVLEVVIASTEPGEVRDRLLRRFLRVEMLARLSEPAFPAYEPQFRTDLLAALRPLATDLMGPGVDAGLGAVGRVRASLLRANRPDALLALAQRCSEVRTTPRLEASSLAGGRLAVTVGAGLELAPGRLLEVLERDGRRVLDLAVTDGLVDEPVDVTEEMGSIRAVVFVRDRASGAQWTVPTRTQLAWSTVSADGARAAASPVESGRGAAASPVESGRGAAVSPVESGGGAAASPVVTAEASIDPFSVAGGAPLARGAWDVWVRISGLGLDRTARVGQEWSPTVDTRPRAFLAGDGAAPVVTRVDQETGLSLHVDPPSTAVAEAIVDRPTAFVHDGRRLCAWVPVAVDARAAARIDVFLYLRVPEAPSVTADAAVGTPPPRAILRAWLEPRGARTLLCADAGRSVAGVPRGRYELTWRLDGGVGSEVPLGAVRVARGGRITMDGERRVGRVAGTTWVLREWARAAKRRMPPSVRRALRSARAAIR